MLNEFYKLGAIYAFQKHAIVGDLVKNLAGRRLVGKTEDEIRRVLGWETPKWQQGNILDVPELAVTRIKEEMPALLPATNMESELKSKPEKLKAFRPSKPKLLKSKK